VDSPSGWFVGIWAEDPEKLSIVFSLSLDLSRDSAHGQKRCAERPESVSMVSTSDRVWLSKDASAEKVFAAAPAPTERTIRTAFVHPIPTCTETWSRWRGSQTACRSGAEKPQRVGVSSSLSHPRRRSDPTTARRCCLSSHSSWYLREWVLGSRPDKSATGAVAPAALADGRARDAAASYGSPASVASDGGLVETRDARGAVVAAENNGHATAAAAASGAAAAAATAPVGVTGKKRRTRDVLAVYRHRGAQLVLQQTRRRHPFRMDGVFCRQDRGEWAGQVKVASSTCRGWQSQIRPVISLERPRQAKLCQNLNTYTLPPGWCKPFSRQKQVVLACCGTQAFATKSLVCWPIASSQPRQSHQ